MSERDLAEAIHHEIISPDSVDAALMLWRTQEHRTERDRMWFVLATIAGEAMEAVLARRQREAARTGPWEGGHHFQEEDGYPGSLLAGTNPGDIPAGTRGKP